LNLIVVIVFHQFLLPQPKSRSMFAPPMEKSSRAYVSKATLGCGQCCL